MTALSPHETAFEAIFGKVTAVTGLTVNPSRRWWVEAGINHAMTQIAVSDPTEYLRRLDDAAVLDDLASEISVRESYFFRDPAQFAFLRREVLPDIRRRRGSNHNLRVWSAGCASGEEAYSLAILLDEEGFGLTSNVLGTDMSRGALAKAIRGDYGAWSFRGGPAGAMETYFEARPDGHAVRKYLAGRVVWRRLNLANDSYPSAANGTAGLDLILCRNVLIYLEPRTVRMVQERLFAALAEGGWLVLGAADPRMPAIASCEEVTTRSGIFYRRTTRPSIPETAAEVAASDDLPRPETLAARKLHAAATRSNGRVASNAAVARRRHARSAVLPGDLCVRPEEWLILVRALANRGDAGAAERAASRATEQYPLVPELHHLRSILLLGLGRFEDAAQAARRVIYLDRSLAFAHLTLGTILQRMGRAREAALAHRNGQALLATQHADSIVPLSDGQRTGVLWASGQRSERNRLRLGGLGEVPL